jgi:outer membrane protein OmpA-like peptidoglycan-associated protein
VRSVEFYIQKDFPGKNVASGRVLRFEKTQQNGKERREIYMKTKIIDILGVVIATILIGCAPPPPQQFVVQRPDEQKPQTITFPNGTTFGGASGSQASTLAQLVVESNNNNMKDYEQLQGTASKNLQTSQQALQMLEHLSQQQGTGEITLFFPTGSAALPSSGLQYQRLINFVDYLSRNSRGRKILLVMIGSASATGSMSINQKLSQAPEPIIDQYLVNDPHQFFKVYGIGDMYSPKNVSLQEDQRYQNVRIIAVYDTNQIPALRS